MTGSDDRLVFTVPGWYCNCSGQFRLVPDGHEHTLPPGPLIIGQLTGGGVTATSVKWDTEDASDDLR